MADRTILGKLWNLLKVIPKWGSGLERAVSTRCTFAIISILASDYLWLFSSSNSASQANPWLYYIIRDTAPPPHHWVLWPIFLTVILSSTIFPAVLSIWFFFLPVCCNLFPTKSKVQHQGLLLFFFFFAYACSRWKRNNLNEFLKTLTPWPGPWSSSRRILVIPFSLGRGCWKGVRSWVYWIESQSSDLCEKTRAFIHQHHMKCLPVSHQLRKFLHKSHVIKRVDRSSALLLNLH